MEKFLKLFSNSILAGVAIALGAMVFCLVGGGIPGALLFSIGLYMVLWCGLNLYTGKVGYAHSIKDIPRLLLIFLGNAIGCLIVLILAPNPLAISIVAAKLSVPLYLVFIKAIICGILIYVGVDQYKKKKEYAPAIVVPVFILVGAEHSIADICYFIMAQVFSLEVAIFIIVVALGNAIGSLAWRFLT